MHLATALFKFFMKILSRKPPGCSKGLKISLVVSSSECCQCRTGRDPTVTYRIVNTGMIGILERSNYGFRCGEERVFAHFRLALTHDKAIVVGF